MEICHRLEKEKTNFDAEVKSDAEHVVFVVTWEDGANMQMSRDWLQGS